jgi:1-acyl-sn-glycerol-3-phosphate acyltransferase
MPNMRAKTTSLLGKAYGIFTGLALTAVTIPTLLLLTITPGEANRRRLVRRAARLVFTVIGSRPRVIGLENLPDGAAIVIANHASYLDGPILIAVLPPRFTFVIKREMESVPFAHFLLRRIGSEFVDRNNRHRGGIDARRILQQARSKDRSLAFFPEGTFTAEPGLRKFHNGAFAAALHGDLPMVPIVIRGSRKMLSAGQLLPVPARIDVVIKPAVTPDGPESSATELMFTCRSRILEDLQEPDRSG